jgi:hypothetical protein
MVLAALSGASTASAGFGLQAGAGFSVEAKQQDGSPETEAGRHPFTFEANLAFNTNGGSSDGDLRDLDLELPPGFLVNPTAVPECSEADFRTPRVSPYEASASGEHCPNTTQVGTVAVKVGGTVRHFGVFNLVPPFGSAAAVGFSPFGFPVVLVAQVRESDAGVTLSVRDLPQSLDLQEMRLSLWGTPWLPIPPSSPAPNPHNEERGNCLNEQTGGSHGPCPVYGGDQADEAPDLWAGEAEIKSYLTLPAMPCGSPLAYVVRARSWQGEAAEATTSTPPLSECKKSLAFAKVQLLTDAAAARTGLAFNLEVNDGGGILNPRGVARPAIKTANASFPEGLTINPSVGAGLTSCSEAEFARETASSAPGSGCPNGSKIGTVVVEGAIGLAEPMTGSVYVAAPRQNPFGTLLAIYITARLPRRGLMVKSVGRIEPDPRTGRLVVTFDQLPRVLYTHFSLNLREGQRSVLISPPTCGFYTTDMQVASWAEPELFRPEFAVFPIRRGEAGGPCPEGGIPPFRPELMAGSINSAAGAYTPFYLRMTRTDAEQEITSYSASFPPGLLAKLAGVSRCSDAAIATAMGRSGIEEQTGPSCPASAQVGRTLAGFGVGGTLAWAPGNLYLAGPYHGAPLSMVAIDSALVGPFDLGTVVVRSAIRIDPRTARAQIDSSGSDPIPHILGGIPLHLRDIRVYVDRPDFMVNPTSCDPSEVRSTLTGAGLDVFGSGDDSAVGSSRRFQVLGCSALGFKPRLSFRLAGSTRHGGFPALRARYRPRPGNANLKAVSVALPPSLFLAQQHLKTVCTRAQFAAGTCPARSVYGTARARTPLLGEPLEGPVYLRASSNPVPDLVASLHRDGIDIEVVGRIDSPKRGGLRATFEGLPDAPVTDFTMSLPGGRRGLLQNAEGLCRSPLRAGARFIAQSNATEVLHPRMQVSCGGRPGPKSKKHGSKGKPGR